MSRSVEGDITAVLDRLAAVSKIERDTHDRLVSRHIDFISELLAAEQESRDWKQPVGCADAIVDSVNHYRSTGGYYPCVYERIETFERDIGDGFEDRTTATVSTDASQTAACPCKDPLANSEETLDAIIAVVIAPDDRPPRERYFDRHWREVVVKLRDYYGSWEDISNHSVETLYERTRSFALNHRGGVARHRLKRLLDALKYFRDHRYFDELAFETVSRTSFERTNQMLADAPGISESDAWWLQLVALDRRVWPSDPIIDTLLAQLGLVDPATVGEQGTNRCAIAEDITPRQILDLHRGLAVHAHYSGATPCGPDCAIRKFMLTYRQQAQANRDKTAPKVVDLFAGAGGFSKGFRDAGYEVAAAVDKDQQATDTYRLNHPEVPHSRIITADITEIGSTTADMETTEQLGEQAERSSPARLFDEINGDIDVVVGGPPCQAFSKAGYRASGDDDYSILDDPRADLYRHYVDLIDTIEPVAIVMENVKGILTSVDRHHPGTDETGREGASRTRIIDLVVADLEEIGYDCAFQSVDCSEYGIPQTRERILVTGLNQEQSPADIGAMDVRQNLEKKAESTLGQATIHHALTKLPRLRRGEGAAVSTTNRDVVGRPTKYAKKHGLPSGTSVVTSHRTRQHPREKDREMFETVMEPGDTGWDVKYRHERSDLIDYPVGTEEDPKFDDKYRMLDWFEPAPTIMAHLEKDSNDFVLPDYYEYVQRGTERADQRRNRGLTPREAARLQTFPDNYIFLGPFISHFIQIGNAVPPVLSEQVACTISDTVLDRARNNCGGREISSKSI
jgi:DNA (cytosine-5)-methyltransferase 1